MVRLGTSQMLRVIDFRLARRPNLERSRATGQWVMMLKYRLKAPMSAILNKPGGKHISVTLPAGAILKESSERSTTLLGMYGVYWEERHYSVSFPELLLKAERVESA